MPIGSNNQPGPFGIGPERASIGSGSRSTALLTLPLTERLDRADGTHLPARPSV